MWKAVFTFIRSERGIESVEYAVMLAMVVAALVSAITFLMLAMTGRFGVTSQMIQPNTE